MSLKCLLIELLPYYINSFQNNTNTFENQFINGRKTTINNVIQYKYINLDFIHKN